MGYVFPLPEVQALVAALGDADVRATLDAAKVNTPGVWVNLTGPLDHDTLASSTLPAELVLVVADTEPVSALTALAALHDKVLGVVEPAGPIRFQGTILPGPDLTALPSLVVPIQITN